MAFVFSILFFLLLGFATVFIQILRAEAKAVIKLKTKIAAETNYPPKPANG